MRKLSPFKAVSHALNSVWSYRRAAWRIGMLWVPVLLVVGLVEFYAGPANPAAPEMSAPSFIELVSGILSLLAVCSMAVSWHRFILRDEPGGGLRLDGPVFRYAANTLLIMLAMLLPALLLVTATLVMPTGTILALPLVLVFGGIVTRLSIKLPAVALGNAEFSFRDAWNVSAGNFWPCVGVFLLNAAILLAIMLVVTVVAGVVTQISPSASLLFQLVVVVLLQLFYAIFNASIFTSLYGFFVERRDF